MLIMKKRKIQSATDLEEFSKKFGTFFEEFKDNETSLFYVLFVLRRFLLVFCSLFLESGVLQLALSFASTLAVIYI